MWHFQSYFRWTLQMLFTPLARYFLKKENLISLKAVLILPLLMSHLDSLIYSLWLLIAFYVFLVLLCCLFWWPLIRILSS